MSIVATVGWIFVGLFGLLGIVVILDMIGWVTIREHSQRKWLFRSLICAVVVAVAGLGTAYLRGLGNETNIVPNANAGNRPTPAPEGPAVPSPAPVQPPSPPEPAPTPPAVDSIPAELQAWAQENLGARPDVSPQFATDYPVCVAELQRRSAAEGVLTDAGACARQLREHRRLYVAPLFAERERYADALRSQQRLLTRRQLTPEDQQRLNFLQREDHNFYYLDGVAYLRLQAADQRSKEDLRLCETSDCRPAT